MFKWIKCVLFHRGYWARGGEVGIANFNDAAPEEGWAIMPLTKTYEFCWKCGRRWNVRREE